MWRSDSNRWFVYSPDGQLLKWIAMYISCCYLLFTLNSNSCKLVVMALVNLNVFKNWKFKKGIHQGRVFHATMNVSSTVYSVFHQNKTDSPTCDKSPPLALVSQQKFPLSQNKSPRSKKDGICTTIKLMSGILLECRWVRTQKKIYGSESKFVLSPKTKKVPRIHSVLLKSSSSSLGEGK